MDASEPETPQGFPPPPQTRATTRAWDRAAIEDYGIPGAVLMENAGSAAARLTLGLLASDEAVRPPFEVLCGPGNNGGDGFVVARYLHDAGLEVRVTILGKAPLPGTSDAALHHGVLRHYPIECNVLGGPPPPRILSPRIWKGGTIIDAVFGTGLSREVGSPLRDWIEAMAASGLPIIALDLPSGLDADTGRVLGATAPARHTIAFGTAKVGFTLEAGPKMCGRVHVVPIGLPRSLWAPEERGRGPAPLWRDPF